MIVPKSNIDRYGCCIASVLYLTKCFRDKSEYQQIESIIDQIGCLTLIQKEIIMTRYISILKDFKRRSAKYSKLYYVGHFTITVGSLIVPALLSIQYSEADAIAIGTDFKVLIYWVTWVVSLLVTMSNGIITLFKIDRKYHFLNTTFERLKSEGWQYLELTGRYSGLLRR